MVNHNSFVAVVDWSSLVGLCGHRLSIHSIDLLINVWLFRDIEAAGVFSCTSALLISFNYTF